MVNVVLPLLCIALALLLIAFGPSRAGAVGSALVRALRAVLGWLRREPHGQVPEPNKRRS